MDEADFFFLNDIDTFAQKLGKSTLICFTATTSDLKVDTILHKLMDDLQLRRFKFSLMNDGE